MTNYIFCKTSCLVVLFLLMSAAVSSGQTFTLLHSFDGTDGALPGSGVVQGGDGNFYGTTPFGGTNDDGTVFEITPAGVFNLLHSFSGGDGVYPNGLLQGADGKFYGTTVTGGSVMNPGCPSGCGTVFSIVPGGTPVTLYNFCSLSGCADGSFPHAGLVQGADRNFYGTTYDSGSFPVCTGDCGTVFKITPSGVLTTLYTFNGTETWGPSLLVQGSDGNYYGIALGGSLNCGYGSPSPCGDLFKITPAGALTILYNFCTQFVSGCPDGSHPTWLLQAGDGNLYGTTSSGGANGDGTVFKITPTGSLTTLHSFDRNDGAAPSGLVQGTDGNFYGVTLNGGDAMGDGTVFKMTPAGVLVTLYSFNGTSGSSPEGRIQALGGSLYGTTETGGNSSVCSPSNCGTIFNLAVPLGGSTASTTSLALSPSSVVVGSSGPVSMTATVASASGGTTPSGVVEFFNGSDAIGPANLTSGVADFSYDPSSLSVNSYQITAVYSGDATFASSTSAAETLTVTPVSLRPTATPTFSPQPGTYNSPQTVTLADMTSGATIYYTNDGTTPTTSSAVFSAALIVNSTETIQAIAAASGYSDSAVASATYTITLSPDYQLSVNPSALTIVAGQSGTATFAVTPMNGFSSSVSFSCSGLPSEATCSFDPPSVTPNGSPITSKLTVTTMAASAAAQENRPDLRLLIYAFLVMCMGLMMGGATRQRLAVRAFPGLSMVAVLVLAAGLISCAGGSKNNQGTPLGTSTVTVTAATSGSGPISHNATLKIAITQ